MLTRHHTSLGCQATGVEKASPRANAPAHLHNQTEFQQSRVTAVTLFCKTEGEDELQETTAARDEVTVLCEGGVCGAVYVWCRWSAAWC